MRLMKIALIALLTAIHLIVFAESLDTRCCQNPIARDEDGAIKRSAKVLRDFQRIYPCPSTGLQSGACPGWSKDHVIPLGECGGLDVVHNLQWLPNEIKTCKEDYCKDRFERKIYCKKVM